MTNNRNMKDYAIEQLAYIEGYLDGIDADNYFMADHLRRIREWLKRVEIPEEDEEKESGHDGCVNCLYTARDSDESPCNVCRQNYKNMWTSQD